MAIIFFTSTAAQQEAYIPVRGTVTNVIVDGGNWSFSQNGPDDLSISFAPSLPVGHEVVISYSPLASTQIDIPDGSIGLSKLSADVLSALANGSSTSFVDSLTSDATDEGLAAHQGKVLNEKLIAATQPKLLAFSNLLPLDLAGVGKQMPEIQGGVVLLDQATAISPASGAVEGGTCTLVIKIGNSAPAVTFTGFDRVAGETITPTAGSLYQLIATVLAGRKIIAILALDQPSSSSDTTAPTITSAVIDYLTPKVVNLALSEEMDQTHLNLGQFAVSGKTLDSVTIVDSTHIDLHMTVAAVPTDTLTLSATQNSANDLRDLAGNKLANVAGMVIGNNTMVAGVRDGANRPDSPSIGLASDAAIATDGGVWTLAPAVANLFYGVGDSDGQVAVASNKFSGKFSCGAVWREALSADFDYSIDLQVTGYTYLMFRGDGVGSDYLYMGFDGARLYIARIGGGVYQQTYATFGPNLTQLTVYNIRIHAVGESISVFLDNGSAPIAVLTISELKTQRWCGFALRNELTADNFSVIAAS